MTGSLAQSAPPRSRFVVLSDAAASGERAELGGKGHGLLALTAAGFRVPPWAILQSAAFRHYCDVNELTRFIAARVRDLTPETVPQVARLLHQAIVEGRLDDELSEAIHAAYLCAGGAAVAVRSSAEEEDSDTHSYAGQFTSRLNVRGFDAVAAAVKQCWASYYGERALLYRLHHGLEVGAPRMAVVVQQMLAAAKSGVAFTRNPVNGRGDQLLISAVHGLGEALVSGAVDADTICLNRDTGAIEDVVVGDKAQRYEADDAGGWRVVEAAASETPRLALDLTEVLEIRAVCERVERVFRRPQDIEWAIADGKLWLLQARAITTDGTAPPAAGDAPAPPAVPERVARLYRERLWDNSNVVESFGGVTSPLTFSMARHIYQRVFCEYYREVGVPRVEREQAEAWMRGMLGYFSGHVYYNLLNWYQMLRPLPMYDINRRMFDAAIGVEESLDAATANAIPYFFNSTASRLRTRLIRARIAWRFLLTFLTIRRRSAAFLASFYRDFAPFDGARYDALDPAMVYALFTEFEARILPKFGRMMALETIMDISYGLLRYLIRAWLPQAPAWFNWEVIKSDGDIESLEPARHFEKLTAAFAADPEAAALLREREPRELAAALARAGKTALVEAMDRYVRAYGYRSLNELKLEAPSMRDDPTILPTMLRSAVAVRQAGGGETNASARYDVEAVIRTLPAWKRFVFRRVQASVKRTIRARESVRFCRTRAYGVVKGMMRAIGRGLAAAELLREPEDIFQLRFEELRGAFEGTYPATEFRRLVALRKDAAQEYETASVRSRFVTHGIPYARSPHESAAGAAADGSGQRRLKGVPSAPGEIEGEARVVKGLNDIGGGILVTYNTNSGWVGLLPSASGLLVEKGSPLSHVAIVAREMGVPTVVQVKNLMSAVRTGQRLRMNGTSGEIEILDDRVADN